MWKKMRHRLKSQKGETIGEVLIAMLVAVLAGTMLVAMISVSANAVQSSRKIMGDYYQSTGSASSGKVTFQWGGPTEKSELDVNYNTRTAVGDSEVISYE